MMGDLIRFCQRQNHYLDCCSFGFLSCCFEAEDKKHPPTVHFSNDNNSARDTAEPCRAGAGLLQVDAAQVPRQLPLPAPLLRHPRLPAAGHTPGGWGTLHQVNMELKETLHLQLQFKFGLCTCVLSQLRYCRYMLELLEKDDSEEVEDKEEIIENLYSKIGELYSCPEEGNVYRCSIFGLHITHFMVYLFFFAERIS